MVKPGIVGREEEAELLLECLQSNTAELVAIYGRRRIGKTHLIRTLYKDAICFEMTGIHNASLRTQLKNFSYALTEFAPKNLLFDTPGNWLDAFRQLKHYLEQIDRSKKNVVFLDELPWLDTKRSGFVGAFEHFWNSWASKRKDLIVVICGSAASWMVQKIVNSKGGLHNRITKKIRLLPFTLRETEMFLRGRKVQLDQYQILQVYMVMGGVPYYLAGIKPGQSAVQNIDRLCFAKDGLLSREFENLYPALYESPEKYIEIIKALASNRNGLTRNELIASTDLSSGGTISAMLDELEESGFISSYTPLDNKIKETQYRLTDEYSLFYLKFIVNTKNQGKGAWMRKSGTHSWRSWSGYAFENICLKHVHQIKKALGIEGVYTEESSWRYQDNNHGAQIDLLIDRQDRCMNICEMKFSEHEFEINKSYAVELDKKLKIFRSAYKPNKTLFLTLITTFGVKENTHKVSLVTHTVAMEKLFE